MKISLEDLRPMKREFSMRRIMEKHKENCCSPTRNNKTTWQGEAEDAAVDTREAVDEAGVDSTRKTVQQIMEIKIRKRIDQR